MLSSCNECGRAAVAYHGTGAWCRQHLEEARADDPVAHDCPVCQATQPANVAWHRSAPCGTCQANEKAARCRHEGHQTRPDSTTKSTKLDQPKRRRKPAKIRWPGQLEQRQAID